MPSVRPNAPFVVAAVSAMTAGVSALAATTPPSAWERSLGRAVLDVPAALTPVLSALMQAGTRAAIVVAAAVVLAATKRLAAAVGVLLGGALAWALADVAKDVFDRSRPTAALLGRNLREHIANNGFPSTHAAIAAALATAVILVVRPHRAVTAALVVVAGLTALARVHIGVHWPLDVIGGAAIGASCAGFVSIVERRVP